MRPPKSDIAVVRVQTEAERAQAKAVLQATYQKEKNWITDDQKLFPSEELATASISWFVVSLSGTPVGVLRVLYDPPLDLYREYGFRSLVAGLDVDAFVRSHRIAEIGRFAVLPSHRSNVRIVVALMSAAARETLERGYTHYLTDIFEGEIHSPYRFHTKIMGFTPVATHDVGELNCPNRRITMVLDLVASYRQLRAKNNWIFRLLTGGWDDTLHQRLAEVEDVNGCHTRVEARGPVGIQR
jgi:hypothetical protein